MSKKIATLWDKKPSEDDHEHDGQAFYAGGSEHSGQQILGPPGRDGASSNRFVENLFNHARMSGSLAPNQDDPSTAGRSAPENALPITFYRNGFTIGQESEFRDYENNREFLEYIKRGDVPPELAHRVRGNVEVKLSNKASQDYTPEKKLHAFSGEGRRLGAPSPQTDDDQQQQQQQQQPQQQSTSASAAPPANDSVTSISNFDDSKPTTTIQIRLVDSSRLRVRVNLTNTIGELISHVRTIRQQYSETNFIFATTFPSKELTDLEQTISDAKLANASIAQKIKPQ